MSTTSRGLVGRLQPRHAGVDQARFLATGDHLDRQAERLARAREELVAVARLAQRLRRDRAHLIGPVARRAASRSAPGRRGRARPPRRSAGRRRRVRRRAAPSPSGSRCAGSGRRRARRSRAGSCSTPCRPRRAGPASAVRSRDSGRTRRASGHCGGASAEACRPTGRTDLSRIARFPLRIVRHAPTRTRQPRAGARLQPARLRPDGASAAVSRPRSCRSPRRRSAPTATA